MFTVHPAGHEATWLPGGRRRTVTKGREGQAAVLTALKELETAGYLVRRRLKDARGRWTWEHYVYDSPQVGDIPAGEPMSQEPRRGSPSTESCDSYEVPTTKTVNEDEVEWPALRACDDANGFEDWRDEDFSLFRECIGGDHITSDGSIWTVGTWPISQFYRGFQKRSRGKPMQWPGRYFASLEENRGVEHYLLSQGLEVS
jgi:hypothetical protein